MVNVTLSVPENIHAIMKKYNEIKWTEIIRQAIIKKAGELEGKDPWKSYAQKHALENWTAADELFEF